MTTPRESAKQSTDRRRLAPQDILGGLAMIAIGLYALWLISGLATGQAMRMGPGYIPRLLCWLVIGFGAIVVVTGFVKGQGKRIESWSLRGPIFLLGSIILFGLIVRPLGIAISAFVVVVFGSFASREARPVEVIIYGVILAAFCSLLFRVGLGLSLEIWPRFLIY